MRDVEREEREKHVKEIHVGKRDGQAYKNKIKFVQALCVLFYVQNLDLSSVSFFNAEVKRIIYFDQYDESIFIY